MAACTSVACLLRLLVLWVLLFLWCAEDTTWAHCWQAGWAARQYAAQLLSRQVGQLICCMTLGGPGLRGAVSQVRE